MKGSRCGERVTVRGKSHGAGKGSRCGERVRGAVKAGSGVRGKGRGAVRGLEVRESDIWDWSDRLVLIHMDKVTANDLCRQASDSGSDQL
ncbi:hypothetical protein ACOMHN_064136 [Nucella lapillus]